MIYWGHWEEIKSNTTDQNLIQQITQTQYVLSLYVYAKIQQFVWQVKTWMNYFSILQKCEKPWWTCVQINVNKLARFQEKFTQKIIHICMYTKLII